MHGVLIPYIVFSIEAAAHLYVVVPLLCVCMWGRGGLGSIVFTFSSSFYGVYILNLKVCPDHGKKKAVTLWRCYYVYEDRLVAQ